MMNGRKVSVNLAARPLRNRRFFFTLVGGTVVLFLITAVLTGSLGLSARARQERLSSALAEAVRRGDSARQDRDAWTAQVREWAKTYRSTVDALNAVLVDKHFSWVEAFSRLEEALPPRCIIIQMSPLVARSGTLDVRLKAACPALEDLLSFIEKLNGGGFKNISVRQEAQLNGQWVAEILFTYERTD
jgi:hypothetical protein